MFYKLTFEVMFFLHKYSACILIGVNRWVYENKSFSPVRVEYSLGVGVLSVRTPHGRQNMGVTKMNVFFFSRL